MSASEQVDINALSLMNEVVEVDGAIPPDWFKLKLPHDGVYTGILKLIKRDPSKDAVYVERGWGTEKGKKDGPPHLAFNVAFTITKDGLPTRESAFTRFAVTTEVRERDGVRTSDAHVIFAYAGMPLTSRSLGELKQEIEANFAQAPQIGARIRRSAQVNVGTQAKPDYKDVAKSENAFPKDADGNAETEGTFLGQPWRAQANVVEWMPLESVKA